MKKFVAVLLSSTALYAATPAHADGHWTGLYAGVFGGYAWGDIGTSGASDVGNFFGLGDPCSGSAYGSVKGGDYGYDTRPDQEVYCGEDNYWDSASGYGNVESLAVPGETDLGSFDADGEIIGVNAGINFQSGHWVFGIESEVGLLGLSETISGPDALVVTGGEFSAAAVLPFRTQVVVDSGLYLGLFGKLGYSFGQTLLYGKVGYGAADLGITVNLVDPICDGVCFSGKNDSMTDAFMFGGGVEHMIGKTLSLKLEYVRMEFDDTSVIVQNGGAYDYYNFDASVDTVKVGLNFRLGTPD